MTRSNYDKKQAYSTNVQAKIKHGTFSMKIISRFADNIEYIEFDGIRIEVK